MKSMASEAIQLTNVFGDMKIEINLLLECLNKFIEKMNNDLTNAFAKNISEGFSLRGVFSGISDGLSITANSFAILAVDMDNLTDNLIALKTGGGAVLSLLTTGFSTLKTGIANAISSVVSWVSSSMLAATSTTAATGAQLALNTAMLLFPAAMFILAAGAIVAIVIGLINIFKKSADELKRLKADTEALTESTNDLIKSLEESKTAYAESTNKITTNAGAAEVLAKKIYSLSEEENKSAEAKRQLSVLVDQLNNTMPGLNLLYDEEADSLSQTATQVYALIDAKKEELLQQAAAEKAVELAKERLDVEQQPREIEANKADWTAQLEDEGLLMVA